MLGVYKPDQISKRELSQIRGKAVVLFVLPGDMWPHTQMSRPSHQPDSCWGLSSDWLAARQEPVGMQGEAPAPTPETAGQEELIWAPLILAAALPAPSQIPLLGAQTKLWRGAAPRAWLQTDLAADPSFSPAWAAGGEGMEPAQPC